MEDNFELTQEEKDQIDARTRLYVANLYQQMLNGDQDAKQRLGKICGGALVYHRDHCLSPIEAVYAKNDLNFISDRFDGWMLEAIDHQKAAAAFEQEEFIAGDNVLSYINEALAFDGDDDDYDEDITAASVCRP